MLGSVLYWRVALGAVLLPLSAGSYLCEFPDDAIFRFWPCLQMIPIQTD